jgi:hypothetical protein
VQPFHSHKNPAHSSDALEGPIDIYEDWVVGTEGDLYNISSSKKPELTLDESELENEPDLIIKAALTFPAIYGDKMVGWKFSDTSEADVCMYNISTSETTQITKTNQIVDIGLSTTAVSQVFYFCN